MPTYEYRCENGHEFEAFQKMSDEPIDVCPECGAPAERKISSGAGLVFKGSGFYITDYKRAGEKKKGGGGESAGTKKTSGEGSSSGSGDGSGGKADGGADSAAGSKTS
ncbi:MAG: zinc ribbon domain-containing protein [Gemmatimonadales bacterium]|jgi:putative FmdB family regulatory protein